MDQPFWKIPEALTLVPAILIQWMLARLVIGWAPVAQSPARRRMVWFVFGFIAAWLFFGLAFMMLYRAGLIAYSWPMLWIRAGALLWAIASAGILAVALLLRVTPGFDPSRRRVLGAALAAPVAAVGYGVFIERTRFRLREVDLPVPGLPKDLAGLRLAQISDIHLSPYLSARELARAVALANETRPHVALVTGDLVTAPRDPLDDCLAELAKLRADAGVFGCMGNHEVFVRCEAEAQRRGARLGLRFLRQESESLRFGGARVNFAGVDYQRKDQPYLAGAERLVRPGELNILLSHNPDVFPVASAQGYDVTIAGHTHGGQITVEILHQWVNLARFFTPYVYGLYRSGKSSIYVTRGIGTVGIPLRTGAPPEIALVRLCAT